MKKLLSLLLVLSLLLGLAGCQAAGDFWQMQTEPSTQAQTDGTTEPLFWPPLPSETEETTGPEEQTQPSEQPQTPGETRPAVKPTAPDSGSTEATYYPREDEDTRPREDENERPINTEPEQTTEAATEPQTEPPTSKPTEPALTLDPNGTYHTKDEVALFIHLYGRLPNNYITKNQAEALGWSGGSLERYAPGKCIGGDRFYNREGLLPKGHTYYECDIGTLGANSRGSRRIVFSTDGLVYYTSNHYKSFTLLYGEP